MPKMASSTILAEIRRQDVLNLSTPPLASITDVKHLSSYNWIEAPTPTIAIPGSPCLWSAPTAPRQLKKDSGLVYIAQNAARHPDSPLEPLFRALYTANPSFDICSIDIVTDRNNIRKLLSFINPGTTRNGLEAFTINVEVAKTTVIFSRAETATHEFIGPYEFKGFGHEFEKTYTTSQIKGSTGHHRILSYRFSDLNFIVRHETDGYVANKTPPSPNGKELESDSLSSMLGSLSLSSSGSPPNPRIEGSKLTIKEEGQVIPLESTLEIKTRVAHKPLNIHEVAPQLWISQTPKLVRAYHSKGMFQRPKVEDVAALIQGWEERNQTDLRKLAALIKNILKVVRACDRNAIINYDVKGDKLVIRKSEGKKMLPKDLYSQWDDRAKSEEETNPADAADAESVVKPVNEVETKAEGQSIASTPGDTKDKEAADAVQSPDDVLLNATPAKVTDLGSQDKEEEDLTNALGKTLLSSS